MKFCIKDFFSKFNQIAVFWKNLQFTEEILNGKLHFLCSVKYVLVTIGKDHVHILVEITTLKMLEEFQETSISPLRVRVTNFFLLITSDFLLVSSYPVTRNESKLSLYFPLERGLSKPLSSVIFTYWVLQTTKLLYTTWKLFVFGAFLVSIFPRSNGIRRDREFSNFHDFQQNLHF